MYQYETDISKITTSYGSNYNSEYLFKLFLKKLENLNIVYFILL